MKEISALISFGISFCSLFCIFGFQQPTPALQGRWSILTMDGKPSGELANFMKDHCYIVSLPDGTIDEKGEYSLTGPLFSMKNIKDVCGKNYWGK